MFPHLFVLFHLFNQFTGVVIIIERYYVIMIVTIQLIPLRPLPLAHICFHEIRILPLEQQRQCLRG